MRRTTICALLMLLITACGQTDIAESTEATTEPTNAAVTTSVVEQATTTTEKPEVADTADPSDDPTLERAASPNGDPFVISSAAVVDGELLEAFACEHKQDGIEASIPLAWSGVPAEAGSLAITMHHFPHPDDPSEVNSYLTLWDIDPSVTQIAHGEAADGHWFQGSNKDGNAISYTSPCSPDGRGSHEYTITLYALSDTPPSLPEQHSIGIDWSVLVDSLESVRIVDSTILTFTA